MDLLFLFRHIETFFIFLIVSLPFNIRAVSPDLKDFLMCGTQYAKRSNPLYGISTLAFVYMSLSAGLLALIHSSQKQMV